MALRSSYQVLQKFIAGETQLDPARRREPPCTLVRAWLGNPKANLFDEEAEVLNMIQECPRRGAHVPDRTSALEPRVPDYHDGAPPAADAEKASGREVVNGQLLGSLRR